MPIEIKSTTKRDESNSCHIIEETTTTIGLSGDEKELSKELVQSITKVLDIIAYRYAGGK